MRLPRSADVVIVGSGVMGLSTAYYLARWGCRNMVILEAESMPGGRTTRRCGGGLRHQFSTEINIQLSIQSISLFERFTEDLGCPLDISWNGYLFLLTRETAIPEFLAAVELQRSHGVLTEWLSPAEVRSVLPMMELPHLLGATFYGRDGAANVQQVVNGYLAALAHDGIIPFTNTPVTKIEVEADHVSAVVTPAGKIATRYLVNAAGAWAAPLGRLAGISLPIEPVRHQGFTVQIDPGFYANFPTVILPAENIGIRREGETFFVGMTDWRAGSDREEYVDDAVENALYYQAACLLPYLQSRPITGRRAGFYDMTPDQHPILGSIPEVEGLYCIAGFSGHGFMHAPICGLLLSEEILDGQAHTLNIDALRLNRFRSSALSSEHQVF